MTGSGKTGLITVMIEEAQRARVPVLVVDIEGDLPNLLLTFPSFAPEPLVPWVDGGVAATGARSPETFSNGFETVGSEFDRGDGAWAKDPFHLTAPHVVSSGMRRARSIIGCGVMAVLLVIAGCGQSADDRPASWSYISTIIVQ